MVSNSGIIPNAVVSAVDFPSPVGPLPPSGICPSVMSHRTRDYYYISKPRIRIPVAIQYSFFTQSSYISLNIFAMNKDSSSDTYEGSLHRSSSDNQDVQEYVGQQETENAETPAPVTRTQTLLSRAATRLSFFSDKLKTQRNGLIWKILKIYGIMGILILSIFSIYWGSMYKREERYDNLRILVVIEDDVTINGIAPVIGDTLKAILATPTALSLGKWLIQNNTEFAAMANSHNNTMYEEVERQVHHQNYWSSIYVPKNASAGLYNAIITGDTSYNVSENTVISYYESGRDYSGMLEYVIPNVQEIETLFMRQQPNITSTLLVNEDRSQVFRDPAAWEVSATPLEWVSIDGRPFTNWVLVAPTLVGFIYMIIITFFAFNFFTDIHQSVPKLGLKVPHLMLFRIVSTVVSFLVMSLFYSLVTLAFQVDFTVTFGRSGFLVFWMTNFLTMWAVGAMNEAMGMLFIMTYPPLLGFWMLFWVLSNIAPTFAPMALSPKFFRYGYGMPIHASYEITKVIFFNTYKGAMGRNYGILIAWCAFASALLLVVYKKFGQVMGGRAAAQRAQMEKEFNEKRARDEEAQVDFS